MKKIMIVTAFVFAFALTMNVAFAEGCQQCRPERESCLCPTTTVTNMNYGTAETNATSNSYSGSNSISKVWGGATMTTGATSATVLGTSQANYNTIDVTTTPLGKLTVFNANMGHATTNATANAGTGSNTIGCAGASSLGTGTAASYVEATSVVNTNMVKINRCCSLGCGSVCAQ